MCDKHSFRPLPPELPPLPAEELYNRKKQTEKCRTCTKDCEFRGRIGALIELMGDLCDD